MLAFALCVGHWQNTAKAACSAKEAKKICKWSEMTPLVSNLVSFKDYHWDQCSKANCFTAIKKMAADKLKFLRSFYFLQKKTSKQIPSCSQVFTLLQWICLEFWRLTGLKFSFLCVSLVICLMCSRLLHYLIFRLSGLGPLHSAQDSSSVPVTLFNLPKLWALIFVNVGFKFSSGCQCATVLEWIKRWM